MKVSFEELSPRTQEKLKELLAARLVMKGSTESADEIISRKQPKTRKQWRGKIYHYMNSIDRHRVKNGLAPIYNCDLILSTD